MGRLEKIIFVAALSCAVGAFSDDSNLTSDDTGTDGIYQQFKNFSSSLLNASSFNIISTNRGAAISFPFGVGYLLANVDTKAWNVSTDGFTDVLKMDQNAISSGYSNLFGKFNEGNLKTQSVLFVKDENSTNVLSKTFEPYNTTVMFTDFVHDWKSSWGSMNEFVSNNTETTLNNMFVPRGGWWGAAFYSFSVAGFINTNHFKSLWENKWVSAGQQYFNAEGSLVRFYQTGGAFPKLETDSFTAVAISLEDETKYMVLVLPKGNFSDLTDFFENPDPSAWPIINTQIRVPALNITSYDQHFLDLKQLGIKNTFCPNTYANKSDERKDGYFMAPIAQASYLYFGPEFVQLSSAVGATVNSFREWQTFANGPSSVKDKNSTEVTHGANDTVTGASTRRKRSADSVDADSGNDFTSASDVPDTSAETSDLEGDTATGMSPNTTSIPLENANQDTDTVIQFSQPFLWYLHDAQLGPLYYGSVISLANYQKQFEVSPDFEWLHDTMKTIMWNCQ